MVIAANAIAFANVNGLRINVFANAKRNVEDGSRKKTLGERVVEFNATANGAFRVFQLIERTMKAGIVVLKKMGNSFQVPCQKFAEKCATAWTMLAIPRLFEVTRNMRQSWAKLKKPDQPGTIPGAFQRKAVEAAKNTLDATATYLYVGSLATGSIALKNAGDVPDLANKVLDARQSALDYMLARKTAQAAAAEGVAPRVQRALGYTQTYSFISLMRNVCSVASGALGLSLLAFGGPVLPALALITVSLASTVLAILGSFYKDGSPYEMVDFFKTRHVQQVAPQAI